MASRTLNFTDHRRALHTNRYVYAVVSRRSHGLSIGINLNPDKACNFACPYCQVDRTVPGGERRIDTALLGVELAEILSHVQDGTLWDRAPFDTTAPAMRVGYGVGARVVMEALEYLAAIAGDSRRQSPQRRQKAASRVECAVLLGAPVSATSERWRAAR